MRPWFAAAVPLLLTIAGRADAKREPRTSITAEITLGGGVHRYGPSDATTTAPAMIGGASIGAFITPDIALMYHVASAVAFRDHGVSTAVHTASIQWWPSESFFLCLGPGLAVHSPQGLFRFDKDAYENPYGVTRFGFGAAARVGWAFHNNGHSSWHLAIEAVPTWVGSSRPMFAGVQLEWQYL